MTPDYGDQRNLERLLASDPRFKPLTDDLRRYVFTDPDTGKQQELVQWEAIKLKAELDQADGRD